jgi:hypothetical protein
MIFYPIAIECCIIGRIAFKQGSPQGCPYWVSISNGHLTVFYKTTVVFMLKYQRSIIVKRI